MKNSLTKVTQKGFLSLHVLFPAVLVIAAIGGIGAYVLTKSHAMVPPNQRIASLSCSFAISPYPVLNKQSTVSVTVKNIGGASYRSSSVSAITFNAYNLYNNASRFNNGNVSIKIGALAPGQSLTYKTTGAALTDVGAGLEGNWYGSTHVNGGSFTDVYISSTCWPGKLWRLK